MAQRRKEPLRTFTAAREYPALPAERNRWVAAHRGPKNHVDAGTPYAFLWEEEPAADGRLIPTATLFLTNRECPYRCLMCDLWQNTLDSPTPPGAIPAQIDHALGRLAPARQVKLYNSGNFFDPLAIPEADYPSIATQLQHFERVIVECHPSMLGDRALRFRDLIPGQLEVAVGLETSHEPTLARLNKRFNLADFRRAAAWLRENGVDLRVFLMVRPPFNTEAQGRDRAMRSLDEAFSAGAAACSLIPTRGGNGAMERLAEVGLFSPPSLVTLEAVHEYGIGLRAGRVFTDLWDIHKFYACACSPLRAARLMEMNLAQRVPAQVLCERCHGAP